MNDVHGHKVSCTNPINGTLPGDREDDVIFIIDAELMQEHCFLFWFDETSGIIFVNHGVEPEYLMGVIEHQKNTMTLKNEEKLEEKRVRHYRDVHQWESDID